LSTRSRYQTINFRIRIQRKQRDHQLILKASINRDVVYLRDRIHRTNVNHKRNYLITKSDDSIDMWRRILSDDNNIRRQSRCHCFDQEFSISRTNKAHRYLNSLHQKESDRRFYRLNLRVYRSNDNWRFDKIISQEQICSISRRFRNRIATLSAKRLATTICESLSTSFATTIVYQRLRDSHLWSQTMNQFFSES
jgi:hypothetical protein